LTSLVCVTPKFLDYPLSLRLPLSREELSTRQSCHRLLVYLKTCAKATFTLALLSTTSEFVLFLLLSSHRRLSLQQAYGGLLRVRTSNNFKISQTFGNLGPVAEQENMFKINLCDPSFCASFGFEFTSAKHFDDYSSYRWR